MRVLFWVQHLLGIGHAARAAVLTQAMVARGLDVTLVLGGFPAPVPFAAPTRQLTPVRATDQSFSRLVAADGPADDVVWRQRADELAAIHRSVDPHVMLIEAWPFGRRPFSRELEPLLDRSRVAISVRDVLHTGRKPGRAAEARDRANRADLLLVHADPAIARLADTFPLAHELTVPVEHTGLVAPTAPLDPIAEADIVVSAGGGAFGAPLLRTAAAAAWDMDETVLLVTGRNLDPAVRAELVSTAPPNVRVVEHVDRLADRMAGARVSVSQGGYNTVTDVLRAQAHGTCAVLVPSDVDGQNEQATRARLMARASRVAVLPESQLTPERLIAAIRDAPAPAPAFVDMSGAARTAELVAAL